MKQTSFVALRHLIAIAGLALAGSTSGLFAASTDTYYVNDHLATTMAVADAAGEIAALEADAFGTPMADAAQAARYTGKPYDADMGAYVFPFRNYRSEEARWMSVDPSGFPDGKNANYYAPKPLVGIDPLGLATYNQTISVRLVDFWTPILPWNSYEFQTTLPTFSDSDLLSSIPTEDSYEASFSYDVDILWVLPISVSVPAIRTSEIEQIQDSGAPTGGSWTATSIIRGNDAITAQAVSPWGGDPGYRVSRTYSFTRVWTE